VKSLNFKFWHRWLIIVSIINLLVGLMIAFFPDSMIFAAHTAAIADTFFQGALPEGANRLRSFLFGIIGATIAGYFLLQTLIAWIPFRRCEPWAWHAILWAILLWFVVDSTLSTAHGAWFNVWMINTGSLALTLIPLIFTRKHFKA
jgi:hypothetical protein